MRSVKPIVVFLCGGAALLVAMLWALSSGSVSIPFEAVVEVLRGGGGVTERQILMELRLPRVLAGLMIGGSLAVVGAALQAVLRNPLAEPYILGISSGASVGASGAFVLGAVGGLGVSALAFVAALVSIFIVYAVSRVQGRVSSIRLLLAGVAYSSFAASLSAFILYFAPDANQVRGAIFWMLGGLSWADWQSVWLLAVVTVPGVLVLGVLFRWLNLLLFGDEVAQGLGLRVGRARGIVLALAALIVGTAVATSGAIGFVGLVVPHAVRPFTGPDHRRLLPSAFIFGALLLILMDLLARTLFSPTEIPVGLLTGLLGAPFFLWLLRNRSEAFNG